MKGWKTIVTAIIMALIAVIDSLNGTITLPSEIYMYVYPGLMFILRFFTDSAVPLMDSKSE